MPSEWDLRPAPALTRSRRRNRGTAAWCWPPVEALLGKARSGDPGVDRGVHAQYVSGDGGAAEDAEAEAEAWWSSWLRRKTG